MSVRVCVWLASFTYASKTPLLSPIECIHGWLRVINMPSTVNKFILFIHGLAVQHFDRFQLFSLFRHWSETRRKQSTGLAAGLFIKWHSARKWTYRTSCLVIGKQFTFHLATRPKSRTANEMRCIHFAYMHNMHWIRPGRLLQCIPYSCAFVSVFISYFAGVVADSSSIHLAGADVIR